MSFTTVIAFSTVLTTLVVVCSCYDVNEEINALKVHYGDRVLDRACRSVDECETHRRKKRFLFDTYCDEKLGCFPTDGVFGERIVNLKPNSREVVNTQFKLYTRGTETTGHTLIADRPSTITASQFDSSRDTKLIVHGFLESSAARWFPAMIEELLKGGNFNVISVDWGGLFASKTLYTQATANTRIVAAEIVYLLKTLKAKTGLDYNDVHLIGHSLGAHIAGYVGANLTDIGRISGLDPAEPYFQGYSAAIRLDEKDARFVDVIHSDADSIVEIIKGKGGYGTKDVSGHADFFPNGGENQPECVNSIVNTITLENDLYEGLKRYFSCDHDRAVRYYTESVNNCPFTGVSCNDYREYEFGKCSILCRDPDHCNSMGYHARRPGASKKYYLQTTGAGDFCTTTYQITVRMDKDSYEAKGTIDLVFHGTNGNNKQMVRVNRDSDMLLSGESYVYHVGVDNSIGNIAAVETMWTRDLSWWRVVSKACSWIGFCSSSIKIQEVELQNSMGVKKYFCGSGRDFPSGTPRYLFYSGTSCA